MNEQQQQLEEVSVNTQAEMIAEHVGSVMGIEPKLILSPRRGSWDISDGRFILYSILKAQGFSLTSIGQALHRDHKSVIHGVEQIKVRRTVEKRIEKIINELEGMGYEVKR